MVAGEKECTDSIAVSEGHVGIFDWCHLQCDLYEPKPLYFKALKN